jgi:hypothetical protein
MLPVWLLKGYEFVCDVAMVAFIATLSGAFILGLFYGIAQAMSKYP